MRKNINITVEKSIHQSMVDRVNKEKKKQPVDEIKFSVSNRVQEFFKLYNEIGEKIWKR